MDCDNCAKKVEADMKKLPGITEINLVFATLSFEKLNN
ncbi:cation transporter [Microcoleus sp. Pol17C6]